MREVSQKMNAVIVNAVVVALPYLCFVFFSEQLNPISKPTNYLRRPMWRYGRRMGISALAAVVLFAGLKEFYPMPLLYSALSGGALFCILWAMCSHKYKADHSATGLG